MSRITVLVALLVGAAAFGVWAMDESASGSTSAAGAKPSPLTLTVTPSKSQYTLGEEVSVTVTVGLAAGASSDVTVTSFPYGTLHVASVERGGKGIRPSRGVVDFEEDPVLLRVEGLVTLKPGESVEIPFDVEIDGTQGVLLRDVRLRKNQQHIELAYPLTGPGVYTVRLLYDYAGDDAGKPNVFRGRLLSNEATFELAP